MPIIDKLELALDCKPIRVTEASGKQETRRFYFPPLANAQGSENKKSSLVCVAQSAAGEINELPFPNSLSECGRTAKMRAHGRSQGVLS